MKAVRIRDFGGPDQVHVEQIPTPKPGPGEALVRIRAAGVNPVDWMIREKIYNPPGTEQAPLTLGQDFSGTIEKLPSDIETSFRVGDAVYGQLWGAFAEFATIPVKDLVAMPRSLSFEIAASIPMVALTAWQSVVDTGHAGVGKNFLIHGASGGVGSFAVQFAKLQGAYVYATASPSSFDFLRSVGVDEVFDYHKDRFEDRIRDVDVVLDPIGGETQARSWKVLKAGGMLINLLGEIDESKKTDPSLRGILFGVEYRVEDLERISSLFEQGRLKAHVTRILPLDQAREALNLNQQGKSHGKVVLKVA